MEVFGVSVPEFLGDGIEHAAVAVAIGESPSPLAGVEVTEVDDGGIDGGNFTLFDDLLERAELVDLSHGFDAESCAGVLSHVCGDLFEGIDRQLHCFLAGDFCGAPAMDNDGIRAEEFRRPEAFADILQAFESFFGVCSREGDEIGGMEGHQDACFLCLLSDCPE